MGLWALHAERMNCTLAMQGITAGFSVIKVGGAVNALVMLCVRASCTRHFVSLVVRCFKPLVQAASSLPGCACQHLNIERNGCLYVILTRSTHALTGNTTKPTVHGPSTLLRPSQPSRAVYQCGIDINKLLRSSWVGVINFRCSFPARTS